LYGAPEPHTSDRKIRNRLREVWVAIDQLADALARDAEHLRDLDRADQLRYHEKILEKWLAKPQGIC